MVKKFPAVISVFSSDVKDFSFIVKEKGVYNVYDLNIFARRRKLASIEGDQESIKLCEEMFDMYKYNYRKVNENTIEVFDLEDEEYEELELPLYRKQKGREYYTYMNTLIKVNVPTKSMVEASKKYLAKINKKIAADTLLCEVETCLEFSCDLVSTIIETNYKITAELLDYNKYYVFTIKEPYKKVGKYQSLVIDKERAVKEAKDGVLTIAVPKTVAGIVIGKDGRCTKEIAKDLGFKYIDVKAY